MITSCVLYEWALLTAVHVLLNKNAVDLVGCEKLAYIFAEMTYAESLLLLQVFDSCFDFFVFLYSCL